MKKIVTGIATAIIILCLLFCYVFRDYIYELPQRMAKYHNTGKIEITIDGEKISPDNISLDFLCVNDIVETDKITNGEFKFETGIYGENIFKFQLDETEYAPLDISFGIFNTDWWHVIDYNVSIDITGNEDGSYNAVAEQVITNKGGTEYNFRKETLIDKENKEICIYMGP